MTANTASLYKTARTISPLVIKRKIIPAGTIVSVRVATENDLGVATPDENLFFICSRKEFGTFTVPESFLSDFVL